MDQLTAFLQEHWMIAAAAVIVILIVIKVVKSVVKWLVIAGIALAVLIYGFNYSPEEIKEVGTKIMDAAKLTKATAASMILSDPENAKFSETEDGFAITTDTFTLEGKTGAKEVTFTYLGQSITLELDEKLKDFITAAKAAGAAN